MVRTGHQSRSERRIVMSILEDRVKHDGLLESSQPDDAMWVAICGASPRDDPIHEIRVGDRPLKCLLSAHGIAGHGDQVVDTEKFGF